MVLFSDIPISILYTIPFVLFLHVCFQKITHLMKNLVECLVFLSTRTPNKYTELN